MSEGPIARWSEPRERLRLVAAIVVVVSFVALAALAIAASRSSFSISLPASADEPADDTVHLVAPAAQVSDPLPPIAAARVAPAAVPVASTVAPATTVPALTPPPDLPDEDRGKPCAAFGLPAATQVGGLQSLVRLIPLFGPFSAEAFAMMPAFEGGFRFLGPLFPVFQQGLDAAAPLLDAATPVVQQLGQAGYDALQPLYGPYREQVLTAEGQLAAFLGPIVSSLADAPGSECLVALEGLLASLVL